MPRLRYQTCNQACNHASTEREEQERLERREHARKSLSGSCAGDYLTDTTVKEKPRRQTTGARLRVAQCHDDRDPCPPICAHDPLNDSRAVSHQRLVCGPHSTSNWRHQARTEKSEQERPERQEHARKSLSGSCTGDNFTANIEMESPRRQPTGSRLRVALGHDDRGPCPPVCTHDPLNDSRAISHQKPVCGSHSTSNWRHRRRPLRTFRNRSSAPTLSPFLREQSSSATSAFRRLTRRVLRPTAADVARNPRARCARLRAAEAI